LTLLLAGIGRKDDNPSNVEDGIPSETEGIRAKGERLKAKGKGNKV